MPRNLLSLLAYCFCQMDLAASRPAVEDWPKLAQDWMKNNDILDSWQKDENQTKRILVIHDIVVSDRTLERTLPHMYRCLSYEILGIWSAELEFWPRTSQSRPFAVSYLVSTSPARNLACLTGRLSIPRKIKLRATLLLTDTQCARNKSGFSL